MPWLTAPISAASMITIRRTWRRSAPVSRSSDSSRRRSSTSVNSVPATPSIATAMAISSSA